MSREPARPAVAALHRGRTLALAGQAFVLALVLASGAPAFAGDNGIRSVRVWPAPDYTRVTIESKAPIRYSVQTIKNPERAVLDLEGIELDDLLKQLAGKLSPDDPYIAQLRAGWNRPNVVRLVADLKTEVKPQVFALEPIGQYGHRLVLDIYPAVPVDPLLALLKLQGGMAEPEPEEPAPPATSGRKETAPAAKRRPQAAQPVTIVVDAGHGGEDPGAKGRRGSYEKDVTLQIAKRLKRQIDAEPGMRAVLTRTGDYFIPLNVRVEKARRVRADLFVSIHADAYVLPHARGSSVFALSERGATSVMARWLAKKENEADLVGGVNLDVDDQHLARTLLDLSQTATINDSLKLGRAVLEELGGVNHLHKEHVEQAGFAVLKAPDIPSILVETAFISNPDEERKLSNQGYQEQMAEAIFRGIKGYLAKTPSLQRATVAATERSPAESTARRGARPL